jgi:hypothetical protein
LLLLLLLLLLFLLLPAVPNASCGSSSAHFAANRQRSNDSSGTLRSPAFAQSEASL